MSLNYTRHIFPPFLLKYNIIANPNAASAPAKHNIIKLPDTPIISSINTDDIENNIDDTKKAISKAIIK